MPGMMHGLLSYSGISAKVSAMKSRLLTEEQFREILAQPDVPAVVSWLRQRGNYEYVLRSLDDAHLHRGNIEPLLRESVYYDFTKLYKFANAEQKEFLGIYMMRYEVYFLKECLYAIFGQRPERPDLSAFPRYFGRISQLRFTELAEAGTIEEFVSLLSGTLYWPAMNKVLAADHPTIFDFETALDLFYFGLLWKTKGKASNKSEMTELTHILGAKFDMLNIIWIHRCKANYHMSDADIYALLLPVNYRLSKSEIKAMVEADSIQSAENVIGNSYYARQFGDFTSERLEACYSAILKEILARESRNNPYSPAVLYSYLYYKDHEVDRIVIATECVRYKIPPEIAETHISCR